MAAVKELLPDSAEGELASVCSWADEVRFRKRWTSPLHYLNTPEVCNYDYSSKFGSVYESIFHGLASSEILSAAYVCLFV